MLNTIAFALQKVFIAGFRFERLNKLNRYLAN